MIKQVFAVYDSKAEFFADPMFFRTTGEAMRSWEDAANNPELDISKYAADFTFFHIGTYDVDLGVMEVLANGKVSYGTALEQKHGPRLAEEA